MNMWTLPPTGASSADAPMCAVGDAATVERQLFMLGRLAEAGMDIVEAIRGQAVQAAAPNTPPPNNPLHLNDLALAYSRAARAVRMSIALQSRLMAERREVATAAATSARMSAVRDRPARRARIERIVERLASAEHENEEGVERCMAEAAERLDDVDVFGDILSRPVSETIALICRELGLSPDWPALAQEAWAREEMASGDVGAPFAGPPAQPPSPPVFPETAQRLSGPRRRGAAPPFPPPTEASPLGSPPHARGP